MPTPQLTSLLEYVQAADRVCPMPDHWDRLCQILRKKAKADGRRGPSNPLILAAWWASSNLDKIHRLREHIEFAEANAVLSEVDEYLRGLPEANWHHLRD